MLNEGNLKSLYSKIQTQLFYMIPEKWARIYLYAAIIEDKEHLSKGEMFFYYYPTGLLKKNPINVYEIPNKFNIEEKSYMKLVNNLYGTIRQIREEFEKGNEKLWTSLTISVEDLKFKIEYDYEDLHMLTSDERHIIWQYKYLKLSPERLPKKSREMLEKYLVLEQIKNRETKSYVENMYQKHVHNIVEYNREEKPILLEAPKPNNASNKQQKKLKKEKKLEPFSKNEAENKKIKKKNQILNI